MTLPAPPLPNLGQNAAYTSPSALTLLWPANILILVLPRAQYGTASDGAAAGLEP
jgi:hypothetical protein